MVPTPFYRSARRRQPVTTQGYEERKIEWLIRKTTNTPANTNGLKSAGNVGKVGITDYAQNSLGDIVFVDAPKVGTKVEKGDVFGSVESVKAVSDLYSPVTGTVTEVNEELSVVAGEDQYRRAHLLDHQGGIERSL